MIAPTKVDLFGVGVSATDYRQTVAWAMEKAARRQPGVVDLMAVHGLIEAVNNPSHHQRVSEFDIVAPDGQPVRWALNAFHRTGLSDRVYGPELMLRLCAAAVERRIGIYLYGSGAEVIFKLQQSLLARFPSLNIAGAEAPPFRALEPDEDQAVIRRINQSGAGLVFLGLGCPREEIFAAEHSQSIRAVQVCVGAAFDFHAGTKWMAPRWMQRRGLEWLFRLGQEPRRLWKRYLLTNTSFILLVIGKVFSRRQASSLAGFAPDVDPVAQPAELRKAA